MSSNARQLAANLPREGGLSNRNMVTNGSFTVAQRSTSKTGITGTAFHTCDRWFTALLNLGTWTQSQSSDAPNGFGNSLKMECTIADASPATSDYLFISHKFEGNQLQSIAKGTSDAKPLTLSFWVKSNVTGTYAVYGRDDDNTRGVGGTYSITSSGVWEYKTISIPADTVGSFDNDNSKSFQIEWWLASGTDFSSGTTPSAWEVYDSTDRNGSANVNLASATSNYWQITGVQLEVGTATPFEHRSYSDQLQACRRYFQIIGSASTTQRVADTFGWTSGIILPLVSFPVEMRSAPSFSASDVTQGVIEGNTTAYTSNITSNVMSKQGGSLTAFTSGLTANTPYMFSMLTGSYLRFDAEL